MCGARCIRGRAGHVDRIARGSAQSAVQVLHLTLQLGSTGVDRLLRRVGLNLNHLEGGRRRRRVGGRGEIQLTGEGDTPMSQLIQVGHRLLPLQGIACGRLGQFHLLLLLLRRQVLIVLLLLLLWACARRRRVVVLLRQQRAA